MQSTQKNYRNPRQPRWIALGLLVTGMLVSGCVSSGFVRSADELSAKDLQLPPASSVDQLPVLLHGFAPIYPIEAALNADEGEAIIAFTIGQDGHTHDLRIVSSSGDYFGSHLLHAVSGWVFQPATRAGQAIDYRVTRFAWRYCSIGPGTSC